jgi:sugar lactone lactonase YvrE
MKRVIARSIVFVLIAILGLLIFYYFSLIRPKLIEQGKTTTGKTEYNFLFNIYGKDDKDRLSAPFDVSSDKQKNIYVSDTGNSRILVFNSAGKYIRTIGKKGTAKGLLLNPTGIDIDLLTDNLYVADRDNHKIVVYKPDGSTIREWRLMFPHFIKVLNNKVFVTTYGPVYQFSKDGHQLSKWGKRGKGQNDFDLPFGIATDSQKNIYIADVMNSRVVSLSSTGSKKWVIGTRSRHMNETNKRFQNPTGVTVDENDLIYVVDALDFSIEVLTAAGKSVTKMGIDGAGDGEFYYPTGITYLGDRRFAVADTSNNRVQVLEIPVSIKMANAIKKETGKTIVAADESIFGRLVEFIKTILGL